MKKIEFRQGYLYRGYNGWVNPTGYYILNRFMFIWFRIAGPYRHIQQAEKKLKELNK